MSKMRRTAEPPQPRKDTLEGKETVAEFLARGGVIKQLESYEMAYKEEAKLHVEQVRDVYRQRGHKKFDAIKEARNKNLDPEARPAVARTV